MLAVTLPLVALAAALALSTAEDRRASALRELEETAIILQLAVERELGLTIAALEGLATSPALDEALGSAPGGPGTLAFRAQASETVARRPADCRDGAPRLGLAASGDLGHGGPAGRVQHHEALARVRVDPRAVDEGLRA